MNLPWLTLQAAEREDHDLAAALVAAGEVVIELEDYDEDPFGHNDPAHNAKETPQSASLGPLAVHSAGSL